MTTAVDIAVAPATRDALPAVERHMRRTIERDLGGYDAALHGDVDDLAGTYLDRPGWTLLVATAANGVIAGTASVRPGGPTAHVVPGWLADRYSSQRTGQICRVWVDAEHRRLGVGRVLAREAISWAQAAGYDPVCLHTNASAPGALAFWRAFPGLVEVFDGRPADPWHTVHFEVAPAG